MKYYLPIFLILTLFGCESQEEKLNAAYRKSVSWLWNQQSADGAWHSQTHAVLRDGRALTPYILYYLLQVPNTVYPHDKESINKALEFIQKDMLRSISLNHDSVVEFNYPNYSAAYALRVLHVTNTDTALQRKIAIHLLNQQFLENRGIQPDQLAYGGWGYGEPDLKPGEFGHVDISHTRRIAEALIESGYLDTTNTSQVKPVDLFLQGAQRTLDDARLYEGCTDRSKLPYDGGFVSSMATLPTNKCIPVQIKGAGLHYPSYATASCDGLLALHALGMKNSKAYRDVKNWLTLNQEIDVIDGLTKDDPEQWYLIMHYYHWAVRAEAMTAAHMDGPWKENLKNALLKEQLENGSYINPLGGVNKEDDPLMATIFCIQAYKEL